MPRSTHDKRVQRTRTALVSAFNGLLFERGYPAVTVEDVVDRARVGRSTFYEHFRGKEAILSSSIKGIMGILASAIEPSDNTDQLTALLEHFWQQRLLAKDVLTGATGRKLRILLVSLVEQKLAGPAGRTRSFRIPTHLVAVQLAEGMLAPVTAWLLGESHCSARVLASALRQISRASLEAVS